MSNSELIIEERSRDIGDFLVGRLIPFRKKRMVGPFIFIDHMGPSKIGPDKYLDVDQHPHIGLCTLTYLFDGEVMHADSIGTHQRITPGSVNLMAAGHGVTHTERTPEDMRHGTVHTMHGFQIWIALPVSMEEMEPEFHHYESQDLPRWSQDNAEFTLIAGEGFGRKSPVKSFSDLFMVEIRNSTEFQLDVKEYLRGEIGICVVDGAINACDSRVEKGNMAVSKIEDTCSVKVEANSHLLLFGGQPFQEERYIYWNFVASSKDKLEEAKTRWRNKAFPKTPNDDTYIVMP